MWDDTVDIITAAALTQATPVDGCTAAHAADAANLHPVAVYVPQTWQCTQHVNIDWVRFYIPPNTKQVISETFPANLSFVQHEMNTKN